MRKVFLEDLPRRKEGIDWTSSVGRKVKFVYDDIDGEIVLLDYDKSKTQLTVSYNGKVTKTHTRRLKACEIRAIIGLMTFDFKFKIGDIVNGLEIVDAIRKKRKTGERVEKGYVARCTVDEHQYEIFESELVRGRGCPVCAGKEVLVGVNDITTTRPDLIKYFKNKSDCNKYTLGAGAYVEMVCPLCGNVKNMEISNLSTLGFSCKSCGDGVSYPNKFMHSLLTQLKINFVPEYSPRWAIDSMGSQRVYDFYIPSKNLIIEMDGGFHYRDNDMTGQTVEDLIIIDNIKDEMARSNGITVIRVDCNYEQLYRFEYVRNSIVKSDVHKYLNISMIDFDKCNTRATSSLVKEACDLWMTRCFDSTKTLGESMGISQCSTKIYLKQGEKIGWCDYNSKEESLKWAKINGKKNAGKNIEIEKTKMICNMWESGFGTSKDIGDKLEMSDNGVRYHLKKGFDLGLCNYTSEDGRSMARIKAMKSIKKNSKKVRVINTGEIFNSISELIAEYLTRYNIVLQDSKIREVCNKTRITHKKLKFEYVV